MAQSEKHIDNIGAQLKALHRRTHAGTVIAASAQIENVLEKLLLAYMRSLTKKEHARLFRGYGPLRIKQFRGKDRYGLCIEQDSQVNVRCA
jgi:hypothetical protein